MENEILMWTHTFSNDQKAKVHLLAALEPEQPSAPLTEGAESAWNPQARTLKGCCVLEMPWARGQQTCNSHILCPAKHTSGEEGKEGAD